ncbi:MAG: tetratricopeptide repeat protein [Bacteroidota bacterium]
MTIAIKFIRTLVILLISISYLLIIGCHGSEEAEKSNIPPAPSPAELMQKQLNELKMENAGLKAQVEKVQQDNRTITAHAAELETQLADLKERQAASPPPAPQPVEETKPPVEEKTSPVKAPPIENASATYEEGLGLYRAHNFHDALGKFQAISGADGGDYIDRGIYWSGECQYALKDYNAALESFQKVLEFPRTTKKDDAQMMIGNCYLSLGDKAKAKDEFKKLIANYPASPFVKRAKAKLAGL